MRNVETNEEVEREGPFVSLARTIFDDRIIKRRALPPVSDLPGRLRPIGLELVRSVGGNMEAVERIQSESADRSKAWLAHVTQLRAERRLPPSPQARRKQLHLPPPGWPHLLAAWSTGFLTQRVLPTGDTPPPPPEPSDEEAAFFNTSLSANAIAYGTGSSSIVDVYTQAYFGFYFTPPESTEYECLAFINIDGDYALYADDGWPDSKRAEITISCAIATPEGWSQSLIGTFPTTTAGTRVYFDGQTVLYRGDDNIADAAEIHEYPDPIIAGPLPAGIEVPIIALVTLNAYAQGHGSVAEIHLPNIACPLLFVRPQA